MARKFFEVTREFTRTVNRALVVGHPKHKDVNGRYLALDESADVDRLVEEGRVKPISEKAYRDAIAEGRQLAGEARVAKTATGFAKLSATASDLQIRERAAALDVDLSKSKKRADRIKSINSAIEKLQDEDQTGDDERSKSVNAGLADLTERSTLQPPAPAVLGTEPIVAAEDAAPTGEEGKKEGEGAGSSQ